MVMVWMLLVIEGLIRVRKDALDAGITTPLMPADKFGDAGFREPVDQSACGQIGGSGLSGD